MLCLNAHKPAPSRGICQDKITPLVHFDQVKPGWDVDDAYSTVIPMR